MNTIKNKFPAHLWIPASAAVTGTILFTLIYNNSVEIRNPFLNNLAVWGGFAGMIICTYISPLIIYIFNFNKETLFKRLFWPAAAAPILKSFMILSSFFGIYTIPEVLLLMIHHCVLAPVVFAFFEIGIASVICRLIKRIKTRDKSIKILLRKETVLLIIGAGLFTLFFWELGHFYYYTFLNLYLKLFG